MDFFAALFVPHDEAIFQRLIFRLRLRTALEKIVKDVDGNDN
jgi:hypothetical protein